MLAHAQFPRDAHAIQSGTDRAAKSNWSAKPSNSGYRRYAKGRDLSKAKTPSPRSLRLHGNDRTGSHNYRVEPNQVHPGRRAARPRGRRAWRPSKSLSARHLATRWQQNSNPGSGQCKRDNKHIWGSTTLDITVPPLPSALERRHSAVFNARNPESEFANPLNGIVHDNA